MSHPPLIVRKHPTCKEVIENLVKCHEERSIAKFWGACNDARLAVDSCLQVEYEESRKVSLEKNIFRQKLIQRERERLENEAKRKAELELQKKPRDY